MHIKMPTCHLRQENIGNNIWSLLFPVPKSLRRFPRRVFSQLFALKSFACFIGIIEFLGSSDKALLSSISFVAIK